MTEPVAWHELLALILADFLGDSPFAVESERDLSLKKQFLDLAIARKAPGDVGVRLPDGFGPLAPHNLFTFKSFQETLDEWAVWEMAAHFVNYRKQVSPSTTDLLPWEDFRMIAITARFPRDLTSVVPFTEVQPGVYDCRWATRAVRVLVLHQLPSEEHNALLLLFSALPRQVAYAVEHYRKRSTETSTMIDKLLLRHREEDPGMPKTIQEFLQDYLKQLTPEERMKGLPWEERLKGVPPEERLKGVPPEERLKGLSPEEIKAYLKHLEDDSSPAAGHP